MRLLILLLLFAGVISCAQQSSPPDELRADAEFRIDGTLDFVDSTGNVIRTIEIEVADDEASIQTGLMYRRQMSLGQGMLFLFSDPDTLSFWMANTPIPLDIMFVDADSNIVNIAKRTKPLSRESVVAKGLAQYVVEVRGGFSDRFGIDESVSVRWKLSP